MRARKRSPREVPPAASRPSDGNNYGMPSGNDLAARLARLDWPAIERALWAWGYAKTPAVLTASECAELIGLYADEARFRSTVDMARYKFGVGEYKYFAAPLPPLVDALRHAAYPPLAAIANQWGAQPPGRRPRPLRAPLPAGGHLPRREVGVISCRPWPPPPASPNSSSRRPSRIVPGKRSPRCVGPRSTRSV